MAYIYFQKYKFKVDKLIACLTIFSKHGIKDLDKLKAVKLLYLADKYHLLNYGRPIINDIYVHLDNGPVPSKTLDIINDVVENRPVKFEKNESNKALFSKFLKVENIPNHKYPVISAINDPDISCLSETEKEAIDLTARKFGKYSVGKLLDITHSEAPWRKTTNNEEIDYRLFFEESASSKPMKEYFEMIEDQTIITSKLGFYD